MFVAVLFFALASVYTIVNIFLVSLRNLKAHRFFKTKAPNLPVLPSPGLFDGNRKQVITAAKNYKVITELHRKLGSTFGFFVNEQPWVATKDLDLIKLIEVDQAHKHVDRANLGTPFKEFNHSIFQVNGNKWRQVRRAVAPALTNHKVRSDEVTGDIESVIEQLEEGLKHRLTKSFRKIKQVYDPNNNVDDNNNNSNGNNNNNNDTNGNNADTDGANRYGVAEPEKEIVEEESMILHADDMFQRYTLAVIFLITYKRERIIDFKSDQDKWVNKMDIAARQIVNPLMKLSNMFPFMRPLIANLIKLHPLGKMELQIIEYIQEATDLNRVAREQHEAGQTEKPFGELKSSGTFKRRLVDTIIDALLDKKIGYDEFLGSLLFLLLAGFMTTADTITCLIWQLARHPEIQTKLRKEVERDGIDSEYLMWCIHETIRFHPAVPLGVGRILGEDVRVNGTFLPKGTFVMPSTHSIHHDPDIWPEPERFLPERWRQTNHWHPAAFMGFGLGPRNCVGGKLAIHEIKMVVQMILKNFSIERCDETPEEYNFSSPGLLYTSMDAPIKVRLVALKQQQQQQQQQPQPQPQTQAQTQSQEAAR